MSLKKKNQNPTIKITFNYTPFILYTPGSLTEVANKPKPNRYVRERKGSSSPTAKRGAPQLSCAEAWDNHSGTGQGHSSSAFPFRSREGRQQSRKSRKSRALPHCSVSQGKAVTVPPFHNSSSPRLTAVKMNGTQLSLLTAD